MPGPRPASSTRWPAGQGDWTAIWYLGQKAWFHNPQTQPTAVNAEGLIATPEGGRQEIPVYGRAYPEKAAYPAGVPVQAVSPLPYKLAAGQKYAVGDRMTGRVLLRPDLRHAKHAVVRGKDVYYEIQLGHRVAFVRAADVDRAALGLLSPLARPSGERVAPGGRQCRPPGATRVRSGAVPGLSPAGTSPPAAA